MNLLFKLCYHSYCDKVCYKSPVWALQMLNKCYLFTYLLLTYLTYLLTYFHKQNFVAKTSDYNFLKIYGSFILFRLVSLILHGTLLNMLGRPLISTCWAGRPKLSASCDALAHHWNVASKMFIEACWIVFFSLSCL